MKRPNFESIFDGKNDFCEISVSKPVNTFVPHQALDLKELVSRFERGQRLNVHNNFAPGSNFENITDDEALARLKSESMETDDFPPTDVHDVADVEAHYRALQEQKQDFKRRMKEKKEKAQQAQQKQAQPANDAPPTPSPASE